MVLKNKLIEIFTKSNGRRTKYIYTNIINEDIFFLTSCLDNELVFADMNSYFTCLELIKDKEEIYDFLNKFYINKKEDLVFNIHILFSLLNKIKWDLDQIQVSKKEYIEVDNGLTKTIIGVPKIDSTHYDRLKLKLMEQNMKNNKCKNEYYLINRNLIKDLIYKYKIENENSILNGRDITLLKSQIPTLSNNVFLKIRLFDNYYDYGMCSYQDNYISNTFKLNRKMPIKQKEL